MENWWLEYKREVPGMNIGICYHHGTFESAVEAAKKWVIHPDSVVVIRDGKNRQVREVTASDKGEK